jgi:hypothetical protein
MSFLEGIKAIPGVRLARALGPLRAVIPRAGVARARDEPSSRRNNSLGNALGF